MLTVKEVIDSLVDSNKLEDDYDCPERDFEYVSEGNIDLDRLCDQY